MESEHLPFLLWHSRVSWERLVAGVWSRVQGNRLYSVLKAFIQLFILFQSLVSYWLYYISPNANVI